MDQWNNGVSCLRLNLETHSKLSKITEKSQISSFSKGRSLKSYTPLKYSTHPFNSRFSWSSSGLSTGTSAGGRRPYDVSWVDKYHISEMRLLDAVPFDSTSNADFSSARNRSIAAPHVYPIYSYLRHLQQSECMDEWQWCDERIDWAQIRQSNKIRTILSQNSYRELAVSESAIINQELSAYYYEHQCAYNRCLCIANMQFCISYWLRWASKCSTLTSSIIIYAESEQLVPESTCSEMRRLDWYTRRHRHRFKAICAVSLTTVHGY